MTFIWQQWAAFIGTVLLTVAVFYTLRLRFSLSQLVSAVCVVVLGIPCMIIGYLFGHAQSGFITGYMLYRRFDGGGK